VGSSSAATAGIVLRGGGLGGTTCGVCTGVTVVGAGLRQSGLRRNTTLRHRKQAPLAASGVRPNAGKRNRRGPDALLGQTVRIQNWLGRFAVAHLGGCGGGRGFTWSAIRFGPAFDHGGRTGEVGGGSVAG
jgi:hypothetical protein